MHSSLLLTCLLATCILRARSLSLFTPTTNELSEEVNPSSYLNYYSLIDKTTKNLLPYEKSLVMDLRHVRNEHEFHMALRRYLLRRNSYQESLIDYYVKNFGIPKVVTDKGIDDERYANGEAFETEVLNIIQDEITEHDDSEESKEAENGYVLKQGAYKWKTDQTEARNRANFDEEGATSDHWVKQLPASLDKDKTDFWYTEPTSGIDFTTGRKNQASEGFESNGEKVTEANDSSGKSEDEEIERILNLKDEISEKAKETEEEIEGDVEENIIHFSSAEEPIVQDTTNSIRELEDGVLNVEKTSHDGLETFEKFEYESIYTETQNIAQTLWDEDKNMAAVLLQDGEQNSQDASEIKKLEVVSDEGERIKDTAVNEELKDDNIVEKTFHGETQDVGKDKDATENAKFGQESADGNISYGAAHEEGNLKDSTEKEKFQDVNVETKSAHEEIDDGENFQDTIVKAKTKDDIVQAEISYEETNEDSKFQQVTEKEMSDETSFEAKNSYPDMEKGTEFQDTTAKEKIEDESVEEETSYKETNEDSKFQGVAGKEMSDDTTVEAKNSNPVMDKEKFQDESVEVKTPHRDTDEGVKFQDATENLETFANENIGAKSTEVDGKTENIADGITDDITRFTGQSSKPMINMNVQDRPLDSDNENLRKVEEKSTDDMIEGEINTAEIKENNENGKSFSQKDDNDFKGTVAVDERSSNDVKEGISHPISDITRSSEFNDEKVSKTELESKKGGEVEQNNFERLDKISEDMTDIVKQMSSEKENKDESFESVSISTEGDGIQDETISKQSQAPELNEKQMYEQTDYFVSHRSDLSEDTRSGNSPSENSGTNGFETNDEISSPGEYTHSESGEDDYDTDYDESTTYTKEETTMGFLKDDASSELRKSNYKNIKRPSLTTPDLWIQSPAEELIIHSDQPKTIRELELEKRYKSIAQLLRVCRDYLKKRFGTADGQS